MPSAYPIAPVRPPSGLIHSQAASIPLTGQSKAMTYCVGILLDAGMVFASDSRTNAGIDQVSSFSKMRLFERPGDRMVVILSSGNLSVTQNAINLLELRNRQESGEQNLWSARSMFDVANLLGEALRSILK